MTVRIDPTYHNRIRICHQCSLIAQVECNHDDNSITGWCKDRGVPVLALALDPDCRLPEARER